jgi:hypothetical protein
MLSVISVMSMMSSMTGIINAGIINVPVHYVFDAMMSDVLGVLISVKL